MTAAVGDRGEATLVVGDDDTAVALSSGDLPVLGTPRLAALMEQAACAALLGRLSETDTTVGVHLDLQHLAASRLGAKVRATAIVTAVDGRRIRFDIVADEDRDGTAYHVGTAAHERVVVDRERFLGR